MPPRLVIIAPQSVRDHSARPRRFLDPWPLPRMPTSTAIIAAWFANDEALEAQFYQRQTPLRRTLDAARLILRHYLTLARATHIYCLDGVHFEALMLLARLHLFPTHGKTILRFSFHDRSLHAMASRLRAAPPAFKVEVITRDQANRFASEISPSKVHLRPWAIDTDWFHPAPDKPTASESLQLFFPGNARRDETLVAPLLAKLSPHTQLIRAGRSQSLATTHGDLASSDSRLQLSINTSHQVYRQHLHRSHIALLPILPTDEPAGLTAAMEALATGTPLLANASMGVSELLHDKRYPIPQVPSLDPAAWHSAITSLTAQLGSEALSQALAQSRERLLQSHSIQPDGADWTQIVSQHSP